MNYCEVDNRGLEYGIWPRLKPQITEVNKIDYFKQIEE